LKPFKIRVIETAFFILLIKKQDYKIFIEMMENIKKALELKQYTDL